MMLQNQCPLGVNVSISRHLTENQHPILVSQFFFGLCRIILSAVVSKLLECYWKQWTNSGCIVAYDVSVLLPAALVMLFLLCLHFFYKTWKSRLSVIAIVIVLSTWLSTTWKHKDLLEYLITNKFKRLRNFLFYSFESPGTKRKHSSNDKSQKSTAKKSCSRRNDEGSDSQRSANASSNNNDHRNDNGDDQPRDNQQQAGNGQKKINLNEYKCPYYLKDAKLCESKKPFTSSGVIQHIRRCHFITCGSWVFNDPETFRGHYNFRECKQGQCIYDKTPQHGAHQWNSIEKNYNLFLASKNKHTGEDGQKKFNYWAACHLESVRKILQRETTVTTSNDNQQDQIPYLLSNPLPNLSGEPYRPKMLDERINMLLLSYKKHTQLCPCRNLNLPLEACYICTATDYDISSMEIYLYDTSTPQSCTDIINSQVATNSSGGSGSIVPELTNRGSVTTDSSYTWGNELGNTMPVGNGSGSAGHPIGQAGNSLVAHQSNHTQIDVDLMYDESYLTGINEGSFLEQQPQPLTLNEEGLTATCDKYFKYSEFNFLDES